MSASAHADPRHRRHRRRRHRPGGRRGGAQGPRGRHGGSRREGRDDRVRPRRPPLARHGRDAARVGARRGRGPRRDPARRHRRPDRARAGCSSAACCCRCASPSSTTSTCVRPSSTRASRARSPSSASPPDGIDFVVVREGTEGPYVGNGGSLRIGTPHEIATEVSVNTRFGVERVVRDAFARAQARPRRHLTLVHKHNVLTHAGHLWRRTVEEVGAEFPDVETAYQHVDAATIFLATDPGRFDVDRHRQPVRRHHHRHRRGHRGRHRARGQRQHQPRGPLPEHVRAGARLGARHRRPGQGRPDGDDPLGRDAARPPRAHRRGRARRAGGGGRPRRARRRAPRSTTAVGDAIAARL